MKNSNSNITPNQDPEFNRADENQQPVSNQTAETARNAEIASNKPAAAATRSAESSKVHSRTNKKKMPKWARVLLTLTSTVLILAIVLMGVAAGVMWKAVSQNINTFDPATKLADKYNVPAEQLKYPLPSVRGITNILLLGVDNRDPNVDSTEERSDTMIIMTIDSVHRQIKLTSLQRDIMVYIPGSKNPNKINSANASGGPLLAMRVVNETFRLNIDKFVVVNMAGLEQIIDAAGGVTVDVSSKMLKALNAELAMVNKTFPNTEPSPPLKAPGVQLLNGRQAVTYARIRKIDSDYARMERQREVIQALTDSAMKASLKQKYNLLTVALSNVTTNLTVPDLAMLGLRSVFLLGKPIAQLQIPIEGYYKNVNAEVWKSLCDYNGMIPLVQQFIFEKTFPFDPVKKIKGAPNS